MTNGARHRAPGASDLDKAKVDRIELEHLLIGSTITGSPIGGGHGAITGGPGNGSDVSGPGLTDSYLFSGGDSRTRSRSFSVRPRAGRMPNASPNTAAVR